jgi:hypothetical protein
MIAVNLVSAFRVSKAAPMLAAVSLTVKVATVALVCSEAACAAVPTDPAGVVVFVAGCVVEGLLGAFLAILLSLVLVPGRFVGPMTGR